MGQEHPSTSKEHKAAEKEIIASYRKGKDIQPFNIEEYVIGVELDDCFCFDNTIYLVEVYARIGMLKGGQPKKICADIFKMLFVEKQLKEKGISGIKKVILLIDEGPYKYFNNSSWYSNACKDFGISFEIVDVSSPTKDSIEEATKRMANAQQRPVALQLGAQADKPIDGAWHS